MARVLAAPRMRRVLVLGAVLGALTAAYAGDVSYRYDGAGRLVEARYAAGKRIRWTYDARGNILRREVRDLGTELVLGDTAEGALTADDVDAVTFHAIEGNQISLSVRGAAGMRVRLRDDAGAVVDTSAASSVGKKGETLKKVLVTTAMLGGARAGFLTAEVFGDDASAIGDYELRTLEKQGAANKSIAVKPARMLDDAIPVQAGTLISGKLGTKASPLALAELSMRGPDASPLSFPPGAAPVENAAKGTVTFKKAPLAVRGVVRFTTTVATTGKLAFAYRYRGRTIQLAE